ncbi:MAG: hypothetical protein LBE98_04610 [Puniceicoccales bacterium]|nr:hypothetical protein [Puniceicoccales bacterium]
MFPKSLVPLIVTLCLSTAGCSSLSDSHRRRLEMVYSAHEEIVEISSQLQNIQQVMLYAGRVNDFPIADMALDAAIAIQGEPDDGEKAYASNITKRIIGKEMVRANKLLRRKQHLISPIEGQKDTIAKDISSIARMEAKYDLVSKTLAKCAIYVLFAIFFFLIINRWLP